MEHNYIEEARQRELEDLRKRNESLEDVLIVLPHNGNVEENPYFNVSRIESLSDVLPTLASKPFCVVLADNDDDVMIADFLGKFPLIAGFDVRVMTDYPGQSDATDILALLGFCRKVSYLKFAADVDHQRTMESMMTSEELAANKAAKETSTRSNDEGDVRALIDFDSSALSQEEYNDDEGEEQ
nr:MAG: hypothetical protein 2 [Henan cystovirus 4]